MFPYNGSLINLDVSVARTTAEETDHSHVDDELVTGHR